MTFHTFPTKILKTLAVLMFAAIAGQNTGSAQAPNARSQAPIDLTGYWVSVVTEDWRYRMVTPAPGDYQGVPMNAEARKIADTWDPAKDEAAREQCKSYGAPALLRAPGRLHITWQDDQTMRLEADAGTQSRLFHFGDWKPTAGAPTLQGNSTAQWETPRLGDPRLPPPPPDPNVRPTRGSLKVTTSNLRAGYLRKNGVPYSENTLLTEHYDIVRRRNGEVWLVVTSVVTDPRYLIEPFIISTNFKKQADNAGWNPTACSARW